MNEEIKQTHFGNEVIAEEEKKARVSEVFTSVAESYDLMNDLMSLFTHRLWKRFMARKSGLKDGENAIDIAGGTADIAMLLKDRVGDDGHVTVFDINREMLKVGKRRCIDRGFIKNMDFIQGDAEALPFPDNSFDAATIGFGIRNVTHIDRALSEMTRVVRPGGRVLCLEFSRPVSEIFSKIYDIYSFKIIPAVGEAITGNRNAYTYLPESIRKFPPQEELKEMMEEAGLFQVKYHNLFNGVAALHIGTKV
jgi:demethylmenaquinone methyltransferase/2-methoxy-6-polyprenyl-1,4-benzoquinol methylase